jgi:hypothetical protein
MNPYYPNNREPLAPSALIALPLGAIKPRGWLQDQLRIQANGLSGHLDEVWPYVGPNSAWLGGDGEDWERGPYFCDGLVPLAYLLEDEALIAKAQRWMESMIQSQQPDGYFGPLSNADAWPRMVALKALAQYGEASGDERVPELMRRYFRYQLEQPIDLPHNDWRGVRYADNVLSITWLYNRTGETWLLDLARQQLAAGFDWTGYFRRFPWREKIAHPFIFRHEHHVVNVAMGIKSPAVAYLYGGSEASKEAVYAGLHNLDVYHGQVTGVFSGDEHLAGLAPTQGTELCAVVEFMFSLAHLVAILGDSAFADRLEQVAYNALPAAFTPDMWAHQYDQQVNQVLCTIDRREWTNNSADANLYGLEPHYGCCTANFHQGWPKFVTHLWMATPERGLAAVAYGPSRVTARVGGDGAPVTIETTTDYPFDGAIHFEFEADHPIHFPLRLRLPAWAEAGAPLLLNGEPLQVLDRPGFHTIVRAWRPGDRLTLALPMALRVLTRNRNAVSLMRGPLVLALRMAEEFRQVRGEQPHADWAVYPQSPWNYGLLLDRSQPERSMTVKTQPAGAMPFHPDHAPVQVAVQARRVPGWELVNHSTGPVPPSPLESPEPLESVTLIPFGCTNLRIAEFPYVRG